MQTERTAEFAAWTESFEGAPKPMSLAAVLGVPSKHVRYSARLLLAELDPKAPLAEVATEFATAYRAYQGFQDLLELVVERDAPEENRHYCYFESLIYLREIVHCLLAGDLLAVLTLQRPFIELAILHLYWRARDDSYANYYRWFSTGAGKPPFKNSVEDLFRWLPTAEAAGTDRVDRLRESILSAYTQACSYTHAAELHESFVVLSGGNRRVSVEATAVALSQSSIALRQILFLYALAYPMVLFPRPIDRKFGVGGPVGLFATHEVSALLEAAIGSENACRLRTALAAHPDVTMRLEWFDSHPDLTDEEFEADWRDHLEHLPMADPPTERRGRIAVARAHFRSFGWVLNYADSRPASEGPRFVVNAEAESSLMNW